MYIHKVLTIATVFAYIQAGAMERDAVEQFGAARTYVVSSPKSTLEAELYELKNSPDGNTYRFNSLIRRADQEQKNKSLSCIIEHLGRPEVISFLLEQKAQMPCKAVFLRFFCNIIRGAASNAQEIRTLEKRQRRGGEIIRTLLAAGDADTHALLQSALDEYITDFTLPPRYGSTVETRKQELLPVQQVLAEANGCQDQSIDG